MDRDFIEDVATRGHWRVGDPADALNSLRLSGIIVTRARIRVWLHQEPFNIGMIEVSVVDGRIVAIDYDP